MRACVAVGACRANAHTARNHGKASPIAKSCFARAVARVAFAVIARISTVAVLAKAITANHGWFATSATQRISRFACTRAAFAPDSRITYFAPKTHTRSCNFERRSTTVAIIFTCLAITRSILAKVARVSVGALVADARIPAGYGVSTAVAERSRCMADAR